ncbi:ABC-2 type transport system permease protein [Actinokineospora baliensis]|uniref:ABC transporter permease subunit n=1 Tax=Actinokineospora baliensis TaxID=547056 RepID=UPI00195F0601|nr:ABC transporter permease subunit [Actinokineospora baliensis]MBM7769965.1 ABC-2 type transport system permease protein [Actinokineospora baliensis]
MGTLITAEFRKILTTKLWWALLIPALAVAFLAAWGWAALATEIADQVTNDSTFRSFGVSIDEISWSVIALTRAMNLASIFPMIFGAIGIASELRHRTITTTFLTGPTRAAVLGAKAVTYVIWGLIYGVAVALLVSAGTAVGSGSSYLPEGKQWFLVVLAGIIQIVLWTLIGLGVGALMGSTTGAIVILLVYSLVVGPFGELLLAGGTDTPHLAGVLPNGSANGLTGSTASALLVDQLQTLVLDRGGEISASSHERIDTAMRVVAGAPGAFSLWVSGLIFLGWTALFFGLGLLRNARRDIT